MPSLLSLALSQPPRGSCRSFNLIRNTGHGLFYKHSKDQRSWILCNSVHVHPASQLGVDCWSHPSVGANRDLCMLISCHLDRDWLLCHCLWLTMVSGSPAMLMLSSSWTVLFPSLWEPLFWCVKCWKPFVWCRDGTQMLCANTVAFFLFSFLRKKKKV